MKPAPFDYLAPATVSEALSILAEAGGGATLIAGGQSLMPLLALRMSQPFLLVDINRTDGLAGIARTDRGVRIGPMTRQNDLLADAILTESQPVLVQAASRIGHHQTRNRGTIGGSIAFGEPAAELPATAIALGAVLELASVRGTRAIPAEEFYLAPYMTAIEPDEMLTAILLPHRPEGSVTIFHELARRPGDFALVGLVGALHLEDGRVARARLAWFGMGPTPIKARQAEAALTGQALVDVDIKGVAELAIADTDPFDDRHATAEYRRTVGRRMFARTLGDALQREQAA